MKKQILLLVMMLLPMAVDAYTGETVINGIRFYLDANYQVAEVRKSNYSGGIVIPEIIEYQGIVYSVKSIGDYAFAGCSGLTSVTIPKSISSMGQWAFSSCNSLTAVHISDLEAWCRIQFYHEYSNPLNEAHHLFMNGTEIKDLVIPNSMTYISAQAFVGCTNLSSVHISDLDAWCKIKFEGEYSNPLRYAQHLFLNDKEITDLVIPNSVTSIGDYAFSRWNGLISVSIPNSVTSIGYDAFGGCSKMTTVNIPSSITSIGSYAFISCNSLTSVHISDLNAWCKISFQGDSSNPLQYANHLFLNGSEIKDLVIPDSFTSIGQYAFKGCDGLKSLTIGNNVTSIGKDAFAFCNGLTSLHIPNSVTTIGESSFEGCTSLSSIVIPNSVTTIGKYAFDRCKSLIDLAVGNGVYSIGEYAFSECSSLATVNISDLAAWCKVKFGNMSSNPLYNARHLYVDGLEIKDLVIPSEVTYINDYTFLSCSCITSVSISNNVTFIGKFAFQDCINLGQVIVGDKIKNISDYSFRNCPKLSDFYCNSVNVPTTGSYAFQNSNINNATLHVPESSLDIYKYHQVWGQFGTIQAIADKSGKCGEDLTWTYVEANKTLTISGQGAMYDYEELSGWPQNTITTPWFTLRHSINKVVLEEGVTSIGNYAFTEFSEITSIKIPNSVKSIGNNAFSGCSSLQSLDIPAEVAEIGNGTFYKCYALEFVGVPNSVTSIGGLAFYDCRNLKSINIPEKVTSIGYEAFCGCSSITSVIIPGSVIDFGQSSFYGCTGLTTITLSEGLTTIAYCAFEDCTSLETVNIPNSLKTIKGNAFRGCTKLSSVFIPEGLTSIENFSFVGCSSLKSISLPHNLTVIGKDVFYGCNNLTSVTAKMEEPLSITENTFSNRSNATLYVLKRIKDKYTSASYWNEFKVITTIKHTITYMVDNELYKEYDIDEEDSVSPEAEPTKEGYTFSGWSEIPEIMPDYDVTVTGSFTINKYKLIYQVDGEEYKSYEVEYGSAITPEPAPTKEGHTFSGWSWIPSKMPAEDVTVTGTFTINKYNLTYIVDGEKYKAYEVEFGQPITPETEPTKDGYTFSGWSYIPKKMPAEDVTVTGNFNINKYTLTYMIDDMVYKTIEYEYGATITPEPQPEGDYATFEWIDLPQTMPAYDVTVKASYTTGIIEVIMSNLQNVRIFSADGKRLDKMQKGLNIVILGDGTVKKVVMK